MSDIRKKIAESFGYTTNLPTINQMHDDVVDRKGGKDVGKNPAYMPTEKFRKVIKMLMGANPTEVQGELENAIDFTALKRLASKMAFGKLFLNNLNTIQLNVEKGKDGNKEEMMKAWNEIKDKIPYWFLAQLPPKDTQEDLPEDDKKALMNLREIMEEFNKTAKKAGEEYSKETEHADRDTQAKKNLDKARKDAKMDNLDAGGEKKMEKTPENKNQLDGKDKK